MEKEKFYVPCRICKQTFDESTVLQNSRNDAYCTDCFKKTLSLEPTKSQCAAGDIRREKREVDASRTTRPSKPRKMFPRPEIYVQNPQSHYLQATTSTTSMMSVSRRPLQCPKADCSKYISVCTLERHFQTEHREVPIVTTHLDARCASEIFPRDIRYYTVHCVALLRIAEDDIQWLRQESKINFTTETTDPVMMLMTTRIPNYCSNEQRFDAQNIGEVATYVTATKDNVEEVFRSGDRIIVWLASNIGSNLSYTVAVSTLDNEIRQKYFGPILTLNEQPERICKQGNCLILTQLHCIAMSKNGTKPLALDAVIHSPD